MVTDERAGKIVPIRIEEEMRQAYLDYAMSVIVSRALPDVRDGLKPVQRRILYTMSELGLRPNTAYKKSAKIVGDAMGKYHPHGDAPIYEALVRMAQDFSMRYPLVDGQGNFGCFTGDTKIKLLDGSERTFAELAQLPSGEPFYVYSVDASGKIVVGSGHSARITRRKAQVVELTFDDGTAVRCTPDHRFMLRDGAWKEAQHLTIDDSLMAGYFDRAPVNPRTSEYLRVLQPRTGEYEFVHRLADEYNVRNGLAAPVKAPFVRHHKNFDRFDNRPTNVERLSQREHRRIHAERVRTLWEREDFRAAQRDGIRGYYAANPDAVELRRQRMIARNRDATFRSVNGARVARALRERHVRDPERARQRGEHLRQLWRDPAYRAKMSRALRGVVKRPLSPAEKARVAEIISVKSRSMWSDPQKRGQIVDAIRAAMADPALRTRLSEGGRQLWQRPTYRAKFAPDHHRRMAHALWARSAPRAEKRALLERLRQDPEYRQAHAAAVRASNARRLARNPRMMAELAARSAETLRVRWQDPEYTRQVMRTKIAGYASRLLAEAGPGGLSPELYDARRTANWIPNSSKALRYFESFDELVVVAATHNHRVVSIRWLDETFDVYDITVDEHHNFMLANGCVVHNSVDGDPPASMRYTEARMAAITEEMLVDIDKDTVDFVPNYDGSEQQPEVLPSRLPNLLVNGAAGIAVGMATNIPPQNLGEICDALVRLIDNPETTTDDLLKIVKGPDFPTAGIIIGREGIKSAYATGQGKIILRARTQVEEFGRGDRLRIIVSELPFQVNKATLISKIADLVKDKRIDGIADLRDESDRDGMRICIELSRTGQPKTVLNALYKHTAMQTSFSVNMLCLVDGQPKTVNLLTALKQYLLFRRDVIRRRSEFELNKAREREHILAGLVKALDKIDAIIRLIRNSASAAAAREGLMARPFSFSERQAQAILDMQLSRLAALEREKIQAEYEEVIKRIAYLEDLLANPRKIDLLIREDVTDLKRKFGDERRTQIVAQELEDFSDEDLIPHEPVVVTLSQRGYIKRLPLETYRKQRRGGRGVTGMSMREEDAVRRLIVADTHDNILFFTDRGRVFPLKVFDVPDAGRTAKGIPLINVVDIAQGELVTALIATAAFEHDCLIMGTKMGEVKRTQLKEFVQIRRNGLIAMNLEPGDELISARLARSTDDIIMVSAQGQAVRFKVDDLRMASRQSGGVRGMRLAKGDSVVAMEVADPKGLLLSLSEKGFGKKTPISEYPQHNRGGGGVKTFTIMPKTGPLVTAKVVNDAQDLMLISRDGIVMRTTVASIRRTGRAASGVAVMSVGPGDAVASIATIDVNDGTANGATNGATTVKATAALDAAKPATNGNGRRPSRGPGTNGKR